MLLFIPLHADVLTCHSSFLQSIFPKFCERADAFMERLKPWADGKTQVPMKKEIYRFSVDFVSQVWSNTFIYFYKCMH